jgi:hypothetical protein
MRTSSNSGADTSADAGADAGAEVDATACDSTDASPGTAVDPDAAASLAAVEIVASMATTVLSTNFTAPSLRTQ